MQTTTFLMFEGDAEKWLDLAVSSVPESSITFIERYGADGPGAEGTVSMAEAVIGGLVVRCNDSFVHHAFTFTPSISLFIDLDDEVQHAAVHERLSAGGELLMEPGNYGFSRWFSWLADPYGVTWQLNVP